MKLRVYIDGACRGNPGPAAVGVAVQDARGRTIREHRRRLGDATNNIAEYSALLDALRIARELGASEIEVYSDSQLLVRQFNGQYRVKNERLARCLAEARSLQEGFASVRLAHIPRELNRSADRLANDALDEPPRNYSAPPTENSSEGDLSHAAPPMTQGPAAGPRRGLRTTAPKTA